MSQANIIRQKAHLYRHDTAQYLSEMVKIPSVSCQEKGVVQKIKELLELAGVKDVWIDRLGNCIARVGRGSKILAIDAHIDTVDTGDLSAWDFPPFSGSIHSDVVHGRGTVDQEGGAASMITAARILTELAYDGEYSVYFTFTVMEEDCDGLCWEYLINKEKLVPDIAVITEPTNLGIYRGHRGRMEMELIFKGLSAHGSAPERGKNVIYSAARIALEIEKLNDVLPSDSFLGKGTIAATLLHTKAPSLCAIPDMAHMHIDRRLTWGENKESALAELQKICKDDVKIDIPVYDNPSYKGTVYPLEKYFPTWKIPEDHPLVKVGEKTYEHLFQEKPRIDKWTFSTNGVSLCGRHGIPCIGFGPGNEIYAHAPNEKIPIEHLEKAAAFYTLLAYEL
ncbi:MAG: YgeY family selenium metabolism-linked hydrolase [Candidatus Marinimicrobia bacterium]|nr:YgeY family selenium metabolism-linked hydrolase [Candidatus Neomarinimicrobiota bacterium]